MKKRKEGKGKEMKKKENRGRENFYLHEKII